MSRILRRRGEAGFTLPELLVVIVILGLIATPLASAIFVGFHDTGNVVDRFSRNHDLNMLSSFLDTDVQSAQGVYTTSTVSFTVDLNGVSFPHDSTSGWAAGTNGYIINTTSGGSQWDVQHDNLTPDPVTGNLFTGTLYDIAMAKDNLTGWAVGQGGVILATTDGGVTWTAQSSGTTNDLHSVWVWQGGPGPAGTPTQAWAVGDSGVIRTLVCTTPNCSSSAATWATQPSPTTAGLTAVAFDGGGKNGMAVGTGGVIVTSANLGPWTVTKTVGTSLNGVGVKDGTHAWAVGAGGLIEACGGGCMTNNPSWTASSPTSASLAGVWAVSNEVWVVGAGGVLMTCTNAGKTSDCSKGTGSWILPAPPGTGTTNDLTAVAATDSTHAWAVGKSATILATQVNLWTAETTSATSDLRGVWALDKDHVWIVGLGGVMLSTVNGSTAQTWTSCADTTCPTANDLYAVTALTGPAGNNAAWAVGDKGTVLTCSAQCNTAGAAWKAQTHVPTEAPLLTAVNGNDNNHVWAVGLGGTIWYCSNANGQKACNDPGNGATWLAQAPAVVGTDLFGVSAGDNNHVWAVGANCSIWYTSNSGTIWTAQVPPSGCTGTLRSIWAIDNNHAIAVGDGGTILYTDDAGASWVDQCGTATTGACPTSTDLNGLEIQDPNHFVLAAGDGGLVGVCSNNCNTPTDAAWGPQDTSASTELYAVSAGDPSHAWAVGADGTIVYYSGPTGFAVWGSEDNSFLLVTLPTPTCPTSALPAGSSILIDFAWSNDSGDTAATYYVSNGQLVRQLCTRPPDADVTDPFTAGSSVLLSHFLDSSGGVAKVTIQPALPACVATTTCSTAPMSVGLQLSATDNHVYSVTATRRPA